MPPILFAGQRLLKLELTSERYLPSKARNHSVVTPAFGSTEDCLSDLLTND